MLSSRIKNNIYAFISLFVIILALASFAVITRFLLEIKDIAFNADDGIIKEKTAVLDLENFNKIKSKLFAPVSAPSDASGSEANISENSGSR